MKIRVEAVTKTWHASDLCDMGAAQHAEYLHRRRFDAKTAFINCKRFMQDEKREWVNAWVLYDYEVPIGYFIGKISQSFFSDQRYAIQDAWFVLKRYRGTRASFKLLEAFEKWADARGCEARYMTVENEFLPEHVERHKRLMGYLGYKIQGYIAVKHPLSETEKELLDDPGTHRSVVAEPRA